MNDLSEKNIQHFKAQQPFEAPEDYFDEFALKMQHAVSVETAIDPWSRFLNALHLRFSVPFMIVVVLVCGVFVFRQEAELTINPSDAQISAYLLNEMELSSDEEVLELALYLTHDEDQFSDESVINYLMEEELELNEIESIIN